MTVTITRTTAIEVTVGHEPGSAPTWWDPGDPEHWWIEAATDDTDRPTELTEAEQEEAVKMAAALPFEDPEPIDHDQAPDDEHTKPF